MMDPRNVLMTTSKAAEFVRGVAISAKSVRVLEVLDAKRARCGDAQGDAMVLYFAALASVSVMPVDNEGETWMRDLALLGIFHLATEQGVTAEDSMALYQAYTQDGADAIRRGAA